MEAWHLVTEGSPLAVFRNLVMVVISAALLVMFQPLSSFFVDSGVTPQNIIAAFVLLAVSSVALFGTIFLIEGLFLSPARLWHDAVSEAESASHALDKLRASVAPTMKIELEHSGRLSPINFGSTVEAAGGHRTTTFSKEDIACLVVTNEGGSTLRNCQVRILRIRRNRAEPVEDEIRIVESLPLGWSRRVKGQELQTDILPGESRRLYVAAVRANGALALCVDLTRQAVEYHRLFIEPGAYRFEMQFVADGRSPVSKTLEIRTEVGGPAGAEATLHLPPD